MSTRREWLRLTLGAGAALAVKPSLLRGSVRTPLEVLTRPIPSTGEALPLVGLGSSATFSQVARSEDYSSLRDVLRTLVDQGGRVFDTAPGYGASEEVAGDIAAELGITDRIFWATKVNAAAAGNGGAGAARAQIEDSFRRLRTSRIDLIQVHGPVEIPVHLGVLNELKEEGRIRYVGVTNTSPQFSDAMVSIMRNEPIDFIGIDYAIDNRGAEDVILPLAAERRIGVLVYMPFGRTRLWSRVAGREVPAWAAEELGATSWAQFFLKFVAAHPAVTSVTPATSQARNMADNLGAARGRLPDEATRRRMIEVVDALPPAATAGAGGSGTGAVVVVPAEVLERYVGVYELAPGTTLTIRRGGDSLTSQLTGRPGPDLLDARSQTRFEVRGVGVHLEFVADEGGTVSLVLHQASQQIPAPRIGS